VDEDAGAADADASRRQAEQRVAVSVTHAAGTRQEIRYYENSFASGHGSTKDGTALHACAAAG
jgi:hypothetical protein